MHEALSSSQTELALTQRELSDTQQELASAKSDLTMTETELAGTSNALELARRHHVDKNRLIQALVNEQWDLKRALGETAGALANSHRQLQATHHALQAVEAELERQLSLPQVSVIVTTERVMETSQRELFAASHVRLLADGADGTLYYEGQEMLHEIESSAYFAERTQTIVTQTAPGHDVLECLNDANARCARIVAAQTSTRLFEAYAYQSMYSSAGMLVAAR